MERKEESVCSSRRSRRRAGTDAGSTWVYRIWVSGRSILVPFRFSAGKRNHFARKKCSYIVSFEKCLPKKKERLWASTLLL